jgi:hypothetical protein
MWCLYQRMAVAAKVWKCVFRDNPEDVGALFGFASGEHLRSRQPGKTPRTRTRL